MLNSGGVNNNIIFDFLTQIDGRVGELYSNFEFIVPCQ